MNQVVKHIKIVHRAVDKCKMKKDYVSAHELFSQFCILWKIIRTSAFSRPSSLSHDLFKQIDEEFEQAAIVIGDIYESCQQKDKCKDLLKYRNLILCRKNIIHIFRAEKLSLVISQLQMIPAVSVTY